MRTVFRVWTLERRTMADSLFDKGYNRAYIAQYLGLTHQQVISYFSEKKRIANNPAVVWRAPTTDAIAERERRRAAYDARDLTGHLCGDPPPGYSALDRKMQGRQ